MCKCVSVQAVGAAEHRGVCVQSCRSENECAVYGCCACAQIECTTFGLCAYVCKCGSVQGATQVCKQCVSVSTNLCGCDPTALGVQGAWHTVLCAVCTSAQHCARHVRVQGWWCTLSLLSPPPPRPSLPPAVPPHSSGALRCGRGRRRWRGWGHAGGTTQQPPSVPIAVPVSPRVAPCRGSHTAAAPTLCPREDPTVSAVTGGGDGATTVGTLRSDP